VLNDRYENQAQQLQNAINQLKARRTETRQAVDRAENSLDEMKVNSRLRDRYLLILWLGGDREICQRARSLRRKRRSGVRQLRRDEPRLAAKENEITNVVHNGLRRCDENYQRILKKQEKDKKARGSCSRMLELVGAARSRVDEAVAAARPHFRDQASRSAADQDAGDVLDRIAAVRSHATDLSRKVRHYGSLSAADIRNLGITLPGSEADYQVRLRSFKAVGVVLDSIDRTVESLLGVIAEQSKTDEDERIRLLIRERARFK
jgi:hypothetical protein